MALPHASDTSGRRVLVVTFLKHKLRLREQIKEQLAGIDRHVIRRAELREIWWAVRVRSCVDIAKATTGLQRRRAKGQRHVIDQERSIRDAETDVPSNLVPNAILKQHVFKRLSTMKPQVVKIEHSLDALRDLGIDSTVVDKDSGINKIRLPFDLAAAQAWQKA